MSIRLVGRGLAAFTMFIAGCAGVGADDDGVVSESELVSDAKKITRRDDGRFDVRCSDGRTEVATATDITSDKICAPAPPAAAPSDPFSASSCEGAIHPNPGALFSPGSVHRDLGESVVRWQSRRCNAVSGCTEWQDRGSSFAGVGYADNAELSIKNDKIYLEFLGEYSARNNGKYSVAHCFVDGGLTCTPRTYINDSLLPLKGELREHCARLTAQTQDRDPNGKLNGNEYRVVMLARF